MVFVKVRETYDLQTVKNKMTVIGIHTPKPDIIKRNYPGLLMQCKAYRPVSCDVRVACASMLPLDPLGVGTSDGDVAPEDMFNPILYKATSNFGMSQLEARLNAMLINPVSAGVDLSGSSAIVDTDSIADPVTDQFNLYYGLLSNTHDWKHASPQAGLSMTNLKPLVWEILYNVADNSHYGDTQYAAPNAVEQVAGFSAHAVRGNAKPMPFINCTAYTYIEQSKTPVEGSIVDPGFKLPNSVLNAETEVPYLDVMVGVICCPPSKLHELFYRMVVEWTIEFTTIRPLSEITNFYDLSKLGSMSHFMNYSYPETKKAVTGSSDSIMDKDACMVSSNVDINKVM